MLKWRSFGQQAGHIGIWKQKLRNCSQVLKAADSLYSRQVLSSCFQHERLSTEITLGRRQVSDVLTTSKLCI